MLLAQARALESGQDEQIGVECLQALFAMRGTMKAPVAQRLICQAVLERSGKVHDVAARMLFTKASLASKDEGPNLVSCEPKCAEDMQILLKALKNIATSVPDEWREAAGSQLACHQTR